MTQLYPIHNYILSTPNLIGISLIWYDSIVNNIALSYGSPLIPNPSLLFLSSSSANFWRKSHLLPKLNYFLNSGKICFHYLPEISHMFWMVHYVDSSWASNICFFFLPQPHPHSTIDLLYRTAFKMLKFPSLLLSLYRTMSLPFSSQASGISSASDFQISVP